MANDDEEEFAMLMLDIDNAKKIFEPTSKCCIYSVPKDLRKINEEAYTPQLVSIGPLNYKRYSSEMEGEKKSYVKKFVERTSRDMLKDFRSYIKKEETRIRACYAENFHHLSSYEFVNIILNDVVFIFELFLRNSEEESREEQPDFDILLDTPCRKTAVELDLQLLENQIPYFVFKELFIKLPDSVKPSGEKHDPFLILEPSGGKHDPFLILALQFFYDSEKRSRHRIHSTHELQHFTDLRRLILVNDFRPPTNEPKEHIRGLRCATKLHDSGVKFKNGDEDSSSLDSEVKFKKGVLQIPPFEVSDETERLIRNVMAFEQLHHPWKTDICNHILFMDYLIDTEKDVDLLVEKKIIVNHLGDNAAMVNMFNKLGLQVTPSYSCYYVIGEKLKEHYGRPWNHAKATLKRLYFSDPWIATGTIAAALLLLLTLLQTLCSILQVL